MFFLNGMVTISVLIVLSWFACKLEQRKPRRTKIFAAMCVFWVLLYMANLVFLGSISDHDRAHYLTNSRQ